MFKSAGVDAILGGSMAAGPEAVFAEMALLGAFIGIKKLKNRVQNKRERKQDQARSQADQAAEERKQAQDAEDADIAKRQAEADQARQAKEKADAEQKRIDDSLAQQQREREQQQREVEEAKQYHAGLIQNQNRVQSNYEITSQRNAAERDQRIRDLEARNGVVNNVAPGDVNVSGYPGQSDGPSFARYFIDPSLLQVDQEDDEIWYYTGPDDYPIPNPDGPNGGDNGPNGGGGGGNGPNGGGNGPDGGGNNPDNNYQFDNRTNNNWRSDPFSDMIKEMTKQISKNAYDDRMRKQKQDNNDSIPGQNGGGIQKDPNDPTIDPNSDYPGKNGAGTYNPDKAKEAENANKIDYNDELHLMEYQLTGIMEGLSQQEMTLEDSFVEMEKVEQTIREKIPDQVRIRPSAIFSSTVARF